ncbi:TPA: Aspartate aminotransferase, cytoplasmic isozyme 1, variant 3 [Trebouxia sp. C0005]
MHCTLSTQYAGRRVCVTTMHKKEFDTTLNPRVVALKLSKTMALTDLASSMREGGMDVVGLAAGEPDFDTPSQILDAGIEALRTGKTHYTPNTGTHVLRQAICNKLEQENGLEYTPAQVVVSNGAKQSIWQAVLAVCSEDDEVLIPAPFWVSYPEIAKLAGAKPVIIDCPAQDEFLLTPAALKASLTPASRLLILCSPSNPTGSVYSRKDLEAIAEIVADHPHLMVLSDEIYEHIMYAPAEHHSFAALPGMYDRTLTVNGFSKAFAMTGWRLGYLAAPHHVAKAAAAIQSQSTSGASSIAQHAGVAALQLGPKGGQPVQRMREAFQQRRDFVVKQLQQIPGVTLVEPKGAFYCLPVMASFFGPSASADGFGAIPDADTLCRYLLETGLVATVPGDAFGAPDCIRISYAASMADLEKAMERLSTSLKKVLHNSE